MRRQKVVTIDDQKFEVYELTVKQIMSIIQDDTKVL